MNVFVTSSKVGLGGVNMQFQWQAGSVLQQVLRHTRPSPEAAAFLHKPGGPAWDIGPQLMRLRERVKKSRGPEPCVGASGLEPCAVVARSLELLFGMEVVLRGLILSLTGDCIALCRASPLIAGSSLVWLKWLAKMSHMILARRQSRGIALLRI